MPAFSETNRAAILEFVRTHPLCQISAVDKSGKIAATHVPLLINESETGIALRGHVMRKTEHWSAFHDSSEVHVSFTGPDAPVLASWLGDKSFGGTWNYMAVHMRGTLSFLEESELREFLRELKDHYEVDPDYKFDRLPNDYVPRLINGIEGFRIKVSSVEAVFKLSQNRTPEERARVISGLREVGGESGLVANEMALRIPVR